MQGIYGGDANDQTSDRKEYAACSLELEKLGGTIYRYILTSSPNVNILSLENKFVRFEFNHVQWESKSPLFTPRSKVQVEGPPLFYPSVQSYSVRIDFNESLLPSKIRDKGIQYLHPGLKNLAR